MRSFRRLAPIRIVLPDFFRRRLRQAVNDRKPSIGRFDEDFDSPVQFLVIAHKLSFLRCQVVPALTISRSPAGGNSESRSQREQDHAGAAPRKKASPATSFVSQS